MSKIRLVLVSLGTLVVTLLCGASVYTMIVPQTPHVLYNKSNSAPIGWYKLDPNGVPIRDAMVAAYAPEEARNLADMRDYLPRDIPLLKSVWAVSGEEVCSIDGVISAPNRPDIYAASEDRLGRSLPHWEGCITLTERQVFLVSTYVENSFDSRYFGPIDIDSILGTTEYLGRNPLVSERASTIGGLGAGTGAEGKIKANSSSSLLTHCLHIFFGRPKILGGRTPFFAQSLASIGIRGRAPFRNASIYKVSG